MLHAVLFGDPPPEVGVTEADTESETGTDPETGITDTKGHRPTGPEEQLLPLDVPDQPIPAAAPKPVRRKRASVPTWDEIMFGGPKEK